MQPIDRRSLLATAAALLATPLAAQLPLVDPRLRTTIQGWSIGAGRMMVGYFALPAKARGRMPAVIVVHDTDGLTETTRALTRRIALEGIIAIAPDFLRIPYDGKGHRATVAELDPPQTLYAAQMTLHWLRYHRYTTGKVAAVGSGWGADLVTRLAAVSGENLVATIVDPQTDWPATAAILKEKLS